VELKKIPPYGDALMALNSQPTSKTLRPPPSQPTSPTSPAALQYSPLPAINYNVTLQHRIPALVSKYHYFQHFFTVCRLKIKKIFRTKIFFLSKIISSFVYILPALSTNKN